MSYETARSTLTYESSGRWETVMSQSIRFEERRGAITAGPRTVVVLSRLNDGENEGPNTDSSNGDNGPRCR
jgi:hypothetical protein